MIAYNTCSECGRKIYDITRDMRYKRLLEDPETPATCNECEPRSNWKVVKG